MNFSSKENIVDVSIVVPCYQEEKHLKQSVQEIYELMNHSNYSFEIIFVDDCSKDKTREVIQTIVREFPNTKYIFHETNTGRGGAFMDGVKIANGKYIGFLDIDLEVSCIYLLHVLPELERGADVVIVRRHYALSPSPSFILRHILSIGYKYMIQQWLGIPRMDTETGFKFFTREALTKVSSQVKNKKWFFDTEIMVLSHLNKFKIKEVQGLFLRRSDKTSTVNIVKDTLDYFAEIRKFRKRLRKEKLLK